MQPDFSKHKPEDANLSNIPGYKGHPGQERVKADLNSQHETLADKEKEEKQDIKKDKKNYK